MSIDDATSALRSASESLQAIRWQVRDVVRARIAYLEMPEIEHLAPAPPQSREPAQQTSAALPDGLTAQSFASSY